MMNDKQRAVLAMQQRIKKGSISSADYDAFFNELDDGVFQLGSYENSEAVHAFMAATIALIVVKEAPEIAVRAMQIFLGYCRNDPHVFASFKPDTELLK